MEPACQPRLADGASGKCLTAVTCGGTLLPTSVRLPSPLLCPLLSLPQKCCLTLPIPQPKGTPPPGRPPDSSMGLPPAPPCSEPHLRPWPGVSKSLAVARRPLPLCQAPSDPAVQCFHLPGGRGPHGAAGGRAGHRVGRRWEPGAGVQATPHHAPVGIVSRSLPISKTQFPQWSLELCAFRKGGLVAHTPESAAGNPRSPSPVWRARLLGLLQQSATDWGLEPLKQVSHSPGGQKVKVREPQGWLLLRLRGCPFLAAPQRGVRAAPSLPPSLRVRGPIPLLQGHALPSQDLTLTYLSVPATSLFPNKVPSEVSGIST